jgi:hypothetical protein
MTWTGSDQRVTRFSNRGMDQYSAFRELGGWQLKGGDHLEGSNSLQSKKKILKKEAPKGKFILLLVSCVFLVVFFPHKLQQQTRF